MNNWNMKRIFCLLTILFCTLFAFNASAQEERDSPRRGEGISVFLERNKRPGRAYYKEIGRASCRERV